MAERMARCSCGATRPSSPDLAFFENRESGSRSAAEHCKTCGYYESAHDKEQLSKLTRKPVTVIERGICKGFEPYGEYEFDTFYCGCRGWD